MTSAVPTVPRQGDPVRAIEDVVMDPEAQAAALGRRSVVPEWPADPDLRLHEVVDDLDALEEIRVFDAEFGEYGCGYASFVEVKLTRRDGSLVTERDSGTQTRGFGVLLSRLAPVAVLQGTAVDWRTENGGSGTLPDISYVVEWPMVDHPEADAVGDVLERHGYAIVGPDVLARPIAAGLEPDTNLGEPPWRVFDAWFYWFD
jgi:hypothetical protein